MNEDIIYSVIVVAFYSYYIILDSYLFFDFTFL